MFAGGGDVVDAVAEVDEEVVVHSVEFVRPVQPDCSDAVFNFGQY